MKNKVLELFGLSTYSGRSCGWKDVVKQSRCPYLNRKCVKNRKSDPDTAIGTCVVCHGVDEKRVIICPHRLLERNQIFTDCIHLLTLHEPGNELHLLGEQPVPGGNVDFFLVSPKKRKVMDFVGVELQTLDSTGTVWPERQRFLKQQGLRVKKHDADSDRKFGINWKMTAKTILVQLHHKIETFEQINKHLVLVAQDHLLDYILKEFSFDHLSTPARLGDPMHFHVYQTNEFRRSLRLELKKRYSTDAVGIATGLGLQVSAKVELDEIMTRLEKQISDETLLSIQR